MASLEAAQALNVQADLIYIDGAHDTESVYADIIAWYPHLAEGGVLCGDDWTWSTVILAVQMAARDLNLQIIANGNFWQLR
jgi:predicted O-methyltransferase YrrM